MKSAIVTGATGFIGSVFVAYLASMGVRVLALGRRSFESLDSYKRDKLTFCTYLQINMSEICSLSDKVISINWDPGEECVFYHIAWGGRERMSDLDVEAQSLNIVYSVNAMRAAHALGCTRFVHIGTMEEAFTREYLRLDHNVSSAYNRHVIYSVAKIATSYALRIEAARLDMGLNYVLHSHIMGPEDDKDSFLQETLKKFMAHQPVRMSSGEQLFDVISVYDCAIGYYLIGVSGLAGQDYWVGSGEPQSLREYVVRMHQLLPTKSAIEFGTLSYSDVKLSKGTFSIDKLKRDTGYQPKFSFEETVMNLHDHLMGGKFAN